MNCYMALSKQEVNHEDGLSLEIPSSPYGTASTMLSSRRDSLVSSTNFSMTSPLGTAGTNTPNSYTSFESAMRGMNTSGMTPDVSFSSSSCLSSNPIDDYDMAFLSQNYVSPKTPCIWDGSLTTAGSELHLEMHLGMNDPQLSTGFYSTGNVNPYECSLFSPLKASLGPQPLLASTIVPRQTQRITHTSAMESFATYQPIPQDQSSYGQIPLPQSLGYTNSLDHTYPNLSNEYSPSRRQSSARRSIKNEKNGQSDRGRAITKTSTERSGPESRHFVEVQTAPKPKNECPWPTCGKKYTRSEHMRRHLKGHVETELGERDLLSHTSDPICWIALWPHLSVFPTLAKRTVQKALGLGIGIPEEVLEKVFEQFPALRLEVGCAIEDSDSGSNTRCVVCKTDRKKLSRPDNLTQHYEKVHFAQKSGRLNRLITNDGVWLWDKIDEFGLRERVERFCQKEEMKRRKNQGGEGPSRVGLSVKRNHRSNRGERKASHRASRTRSSTPFSMY